MATHARAARPQAERLRGPMRAATGRPAPAESAAGDGASDPPRPTRLRDSVRSIPEPAQGCCRGLPGNLGITVIPPAGDDREYVVVYRYDSPTSLRACHGSTQRADLIAESAPLAETPPQERRSPGCKHGSPPQQGRGALTRAVKDVAAGLRHLPNHHLGHDPGRPAACPSARTGAVRARHPGAPRDDDLAHHADPQPRLRPLPIPLATTAHDRVSRKQGDR
jgi:hypothetical protein